MSHGPQQLQASGTYLPSNEDPENPGPQPSSRPRERLEADDAIIYLLHQSHTQA